MSSGGGTQQSSQQTKSSNEPPQFIQPYLKQAVWDLSGQYGDPSKAPGYYPGSTVAGWSPQTIGAVHQLNAFGTSHTPLASATQNEATATIRGDRLDPLSNPYWTGAVDAVLRPQTEQFMSEVVPGITSAFTGSGRTASPAHAMVTARATEGLNRAQADARVKAASDAYQTNRAQQLQTLGMAPQFQNMDMQRMLAAIQAGGMIDEQNQRGIDADVARYNYEQNKYTDYIARYMALLNGGYPGGETSGYSTGYYPSQQRDGFSSALGAGMGMAGLALQAAPLLGFSDERLKDIEGQVGETSEGLPLYLYRYKGEDEPRIGPIAQEVAEFHPDAVERHPSGYLMIDYRKATPAGGLL